MLPEAIHEKLNELFLQYAVLGGRMLLFMMIPMMTPLDAGILNVIMCFAGGILFSVGLAFVSKLILIKQI